MGSGGSVARQNGFGSALNSGKDGGVRRLQVKRRVRAPRPNGVGYVTIPVLVQEDLPPPPESDEGHEDSDRKFAWFVEDIDRPGEWELLPPNVCERLDEARRSNMAECLIVLKKRACTADLVKMEHVCAGSNPRPRKLKRVEVETTGGTSTPREKRQVPADPFAEDSSPPVESLESEEDVDEDPEEAGDIKPESGRMPRLARSVLAHTTTSYAVSLTGDGTTVFSGAKAQMLRWNLETAAVTAEFDVQNTTVLTTALSHDEKHLLCGRADSVACMYKVDGTKRCVFSGHKGKVYGVGYLLGDHRVLTGSMDCTVRVWDTSTNTCLQDMHPTNEAVFTVVASNVNDYFALSAGDDKIIYAHDFRTGGECVVDRFTDHTSTIWCCSFRSDETAFASCGVDGTVRLWDVRKSSAPTLSVKCHQRPAHMVLFSPKGRAILSCGRDDTMRLNDAITGEPLWRAVAHRRFVYRIVFNKEKKLILSSGGDYRVNVWNYEHIDKL